MYVETLQDILFRHDPLKLNFEINTDEYAPEAKRLAAFLPVCADGQDIEDTIWTVFNILSRADPGDIEDFECVVREIYEDEYFAIPVADRPPILPKNNTAFIEAVKD